VAMRNDSVWLGREKAGMKSIFLLPDP